MKTFIRSLLILAFLATAVVLPLKPAKRLPHMSQRWVPLLPPRHCPATSGKCWNGRAATATPITPPGPGTAMCLQPRG